MLARNENLLMLNTNGYDELLNFWDQLYGDFEKDPAFKISHRLWNDSILPFEYRNINAPIMSRLLNIHDQYI